MKIRMLALVLPSIFGLAVPAFAQPASVSLVNAATVLQLHQEVQDLKLEEASLKGYRVQPIHNGTNYQTPVDVTEARLTSQISALQVNIAYLQTTDSQRAERNTHMLKEMGVDG